MIIKKNSLYTENVYTGETHNFKSLVEAVAFMASVKAENRDLLMLCVGHWNVDKIGKHETAEEFYKRAHEFIKSL